ncbi:ribose-phosphate diphosphokinase, partial [Candidatus Gottesmanbacteria bacterium]|nr:ribose-phosphate diphosphokinase [Candidatus Gottesmanbacteria bacterium]
MTAAHERPQEYLSNQSQEAQSVYRDNGLQIITGLANPALAEEVGKILQHEIDKPVTLFGDGERRIVVSHSLRRKDVVIIQPTSPPDVNGHIMELLLMIDAARRASAAEITAVIPYFGYSRQDRKEQSGVPISARLVADLIQTAGANRIVTIDVHSDQEQGFTSIPWETLYGSYALVPRLKEENLDLQNTVILSPDMGGVKRTRK